MGAVARTLLFALGLVGCIGAESVPVAPGAMGASIVVYEDLDAPADDLTARFATIDAYAGPPAFKPFVAEGRRRLTVLSYDRSLSELGLTAGELELAFVDRPRRALPRPTSTASGVLGEGAIDRAPLPPEVGAIRLPLLDPCPSFAQERIILPGSRGHVRHLYPIDRGRLLAVVSGSFDPDSDWQVYIVEGLTAHAVPSLTGRTIYAVVPTPSSGIWLAGDRPFISRMVEQPSGDFVEAERLLMPAVQTSSVVRRLAGIDDERGRELYALSFTGLLARFTGPGPGEIVDQTRIGLFDLPRTLYWAGPGQPIATHGPIIVEYTPGAPPLEWDPQVGGIGITKITDVPGLGRVAAAYQGGESKILRREAEGWKVLALEGPTADAYLVPLEEVIPFRDGFLIPSENSLVWPGIAFDRDQDGAPLAYGLCPGLPLSGGNFYWTVVTGPGEAYVAGTQVVKSSMAPAVVHRIRQE